VEASFEDVVAESLFAGEPHFARFALKPRRVEVRRVVALEKVNCRKTTVATLKIIQIQSDI